MAKRTGFAELPLHYGKGTWNIHCWRKRQNLPKTHEVLAAGINPDYLDALNKAKIGHSDRMRAFEGLTTFIKGL